MTYSEATNTLNQPIVSASGTVATNLILGTNTSTVTEVAPLGTTSIAPTWDTGGGAFTAFTAVQSRLWDGCYEIMAVSAA